MTEANFGQVAAPLSMWERITNIGAVRSGAILAFFALCWEIFSRLAGNPLLFPPFSEVIYALWNQIFYGPIIARTISTLEVLLIGYSIGVVLAALFSALAVSTRFGSDLLATLTAMFNPLPAIALLPLALLWFGLGITSLVVVIVHSVTWAVALNTYSGFSSVVASQRMVGQNCGLRGLRYVGFILIPAAFPSILAGLKIGWAFGWRTLIAAELVFGVTSRSGGLGWYIFENRTFLQTANVFAGLLLVIIIGLFVESVLFRFIEARTVRRWAMQS
ncbi:MAG TPA: ABC transporter permease subunit [Afipia sp.]